MDKFQDHGISRSGPGLGPVVFALDDANEMETPLRALIILEAGDVHFTGGNDVEITKTFPAGFCLDMEIKQVFTTGTTVPIASLLGVE